jgi:hypothetical protein
LSTFEKRLCNVTRERDELVKNRGDPDIIAEYDALIKEIEYDIKREKVLRV